MEAEVIRMLCSLFHGGTRSCGTVSTSAGETAILTALGERGRAFGTVWQPTGTWR